MNEPDRPRPVPGSPRPGPWGGAAPAPAGTVEVGAQTAAPAPDDGSPVAGLDRLPVAEHVAVFEAEHARLQRELGTIDQL
ncbi:MAG: hypothetical protein M3Q47_11375 [Actinomycetota bacterium]|nr:hypothetical protein [Actinomycetota bacterium]